MKTGQEIPQNSTPRTRRRRRRSITPIWKLILAGLVVIGLGLSAILYIKTIRHSVASVFESVLPTAQALTQKGLLAIGLQTAPDPYIVEAVQQAMAGDSRFTRADNNVWVVESTAISRDGNQAVVTLSVMDPTNNERLPIEPATVIATLIKPGEGADNPPVWGILLPGQDGYLDAMQALPAELLDPSLTAQLTTSNPATMPTPQSPGQIDATTTFGGYYLPWANGVTQYLSQGANHVTCPNDCTYAFDFYINGVNDKFPIHAAKGGSVYAYYDSCPDIPEGQSPNLNCTNYLALKDQSTSPTTYQIYLHLSQNSIPAQFQHIGAAVGQGEWIANADNTGASWGSHLHFMVATSIYVGTSPAGYAWGKSVDITFKDVNINWDAGTQGGRPCTVNDIGYGYCTQARYNYTSGNVTHDPPTGELVIPPDQQLLTQPNLTVGGWGTAKLAITRLGMIAYYAGSWHDVGPSQTTTPFAFDLDLCNTSIPDGPFKLALRVWDVSGNQSEPIGVRNMIKNIPGCPNLTPETTQPPAACSDPTSTQMVIYSGPNFTGSCTTLENGFQDYFTNLIPSVSSLKVGSGVKGMLYVVGTSGGSRKETFTGSDRDLADNLVGDNMATWAAVSFLNSGLEPPILMPEYGPAGAAPTAVDSLVLAWDHGMGSNSFQARLFQGGSADCDSASYLKTLPWQYATSWPVGNLPAGTYTWCVQGKFTYGSTTVVNTWVSSTFTVASGSLQAANTLSLPLSETVENDANNWVGSGLWHVAGDPLVAGNHVWSFNNGLDYNASVPATGDLTSPPISIPANTTQYLRFAYYFQTEGSTPYWDQRWVQVSTDGGAFQNLVQLSDDAANTWLQSQFISLASYGGHTIRLRFHFDAIDLIKNSSLSGWFIDNITINSTPPPSASTCGETTSNNTPATATAITIGQTVSGSICPPGDVDYYQFQGTKNDVLVLDIDANSLTPSSPLDSQISIFLSPDLRTVIAANDNQSGSGSTKDSFLLFTVPQTGTYYVRVKAQNGPGAGGPDYRYNLSVSKDSTEPTVTLKDPAPGMGLSLPTTVLSATAADNDGGSGIARVEFYWHSSDWVGSDWTLIGSDSNGGDGWQTPFDTSSLQTGDIIAIYAKAVDRAGNPAYSANWNVFIDPPVSLQMLPSPVDNTAISLTWNVGRDLTNLDHFTIQYNRDGEGLQDWKTLPASARQAWFVGAFGHAYILQLNAFDSAGNLIQTVETRTIISATCQPDQYENADNAVSKAAQLVMGVPQGHNFCGTSDVDWTTFNAEAGKQYIIFAQPDASSAAGPSLSLYDSSGTTLLAHGEAVGLGKRASILWTAPVSGIYTIKTQSIDPAVAGSSVNYQIEVTENHPVYLPVVGR